MTPALDASVQVRSAPPVLSVRNLHAHLHLGDTVVRAVDGVSFDLPAGATLSIVGESGCGKSMTALAILGLLPQPAGRITEGEVWLDGVGDLARLDQRALRRVRGNAVSMVFQDPMTSLNPVFRVGWQIAEAIRMHETVSREEARRRAIELLELVGIPSPSVRCDAFPHQLSGGMRQRVMIAIALARRPKVMLADEPTTALDVTIQAQVLRLMKRLQQDSGAALLLITHDLGVVAQMAQRVCVMYAGVIVEESAVGDLFADPLHPYTRGLLASMPKPRHGAARQALISIPGTVPPLSRLPAGCRFAGRCAHVFSKCREAEPPLVPVAGDLGPGARKVRCWLHVGSEAA
ncbi:ABC transporter ATP-binding protein [Alsobacter sp. SYSU M60028]|uniref:ABC transporter ATP-binding protein n=1 Tax=Alsobacter ponti TaxID=2962936 RepID=A0ABT1LIV2_9HYPH|nr:ABC transporter ATP-binding protein [Alsobacter ponti]MCP8941051.1 ABC transporter ATP-binding protein [Alsobacter ponti]